MAHEQSSAHMASVASRIMHTAQRGGPVKRRTDALLVEIRAGVTADVIERIDTVLRPFIDDAESLAASVLTQREKADKA